MTAAIATTVTALACPTCSGPVDVKSRHIVVAGTTIRIYCSADCLEGIVPEAPALEREMPVPRRRARWWIAGGLAASVSGLVVAYAARRRDVALDLAVPAPEVRAIVEAKLAVAPAGPALDAARQHEEDKALVVDLMHDAWIHPLAGPTRRMPVNHNGAFGAERGGERPPECVSGHCGVDLGKTWGEPVHAVHDGVIDFVQRGPNEDRGGAFVRIAHRNATLFSWYFHLAAIPRSIVAGTRVEAGQVIGLLGDTGVKHSSAHLHFALSVKPTKLARERYLDPEPLISIWPLWIPGPDGEGGRVSANEAPGLPVRAAASRRQVPKAIAVPTESVVPSDPVPAAEPPAPSP